MKSTHKRVEVVDKMTLAKMIANKEGIIISEALSFIDTFEEVIVKSVKEEKKVQLNDFLSFTPEIKEEKRMVSALDKKEYVIPRKRVVLVSVGKGFKEAIQEGLTKAKK